MKDVLTTILLTNLIHHLYEFLPIHVSRLRQRIMQAPYKLVIYGNIYAVLSTYKAIVFLLKFLLTRRICLESVPLYHFAACIRGLLRFFRRIGTLWSVLSNNGTNFTSKEIAQFICSTNIKWNFIPHAITLWSVLSNNGTNFTSKDIAQFICSTNIKWNFTLHAITLWSVLSNNGTNFTSKDIAQFICSTNIKWNFIPHAMPWWGGVNMRIIRCVKYCLKKH